MNTTLKVVAMEAGIHKNVYSHLGRKTYGTMLLNKGVRMDVVAKALGHSQTKTTATYYASLHKETVIQEVSAVLK